MTLCPRCNKRPRRLPGLGCTQCDVARKRERRAALRAGAPKKTRVAAEEQPKRFTRALTSSRYLITSAQNATPVHAEFLAALRVAAKHLDAEIVVIPLRYKNPTSIWTAKQDSDEWWDESVKPYLHNTRKKLNANLVLCADVKIQPTASSPLSGFEALTGAESCVIGHPKMQFRSVAAPSGRFPKILSTTGACTKHNYTDTKAGKLGAFHHFLGAVYVEIEGKTFHLRQLNADRRTGEFIDLDVLYTVDGVRPAPPAEAVIMGDIHARFCDPEVDAATFGPSGIVETLNPKKLGWEDVFDGYSVNHHHVGNPFIAQAKSLAQIGDPLAEVKFTVNFIKERTVGRESFVVASNHDDFLARWINATDWRYTGNKLFYLETAIAMLKSVTKTKHGASYVDPFAYWVGKLRGDAKIRCLRPGESLKIAGVECSLHGHVGPNGARGTLRNLARIGARVVTGHSHTPGIEEGNYQVGTSTPLRLEYSMSGPSAWLNTHCVIYANGKRSLITIIGGKWRAASKNTPTRKAA